MEQQKTFFKRCPTKGCRTISGFSLPDSEIKKDEKYSCPNCGKEHKLSKWKEATEKAYSAQNQVRGNVNSYKK